MWKTIFGSKKTLIFTFLQFIRWLVKEVGLYKATEFFTKVSITTTIFVNIIYIWYYR